ncbi:MAG: tetratricopeptide repeat protein [Gemmataceae bacterium]
MLALRREKQGPDHPDTLASMNNLAVSYHDLGRHPGRWKLFEEAATPEGQARPRPPRHDPQHGRPGP